MENEVWDFSKEREFLENLLSQRFNFFLIFFTVVIAGAFNCNSQLQFQLILSIGFIICLLLSLTIARSQQKLDLIIENHLKKIDDHPITIVDNEANFISVRRIIGYIIPIFSTMILLIGAIMSITGCFPFE